MILNLKVNATFSHYRIINYDINLNSKGLLEEHNGGGTHISDFTDMRYGSHFKERYEI